MKPDLCFLYNFFRVLIVSYNKIIIMKQYQSSALSYLQHNKNRCYTIFFPSLLVNISVIEISLDLCDWNLLLISSMSGVNVCHNSIDINYALVSIQQQCYSGFTKSLVNLVWNQFKVKCAINYEAAILSMLCDDCKFACMNMKTNCVWVWVVPLKFTPD